MNKEYAKFNEPEHEYIPPVTQPGHFSNLPEILIPRDHEEIEGDPIEKEIHELIRDAKTPPETPPELEPGQAGCRLFSDAAHYVSPVYLVEGYRKVFTVKLIIGNLMSLIPTFLFILFASTWRRFDYLLMQQISVFYFLLAFSVVGFGVYTYGVGLCRNPPYLILALGIRIILTTLLFGSLMLVIHSIFIKLVIFREGQTRTSNKTYEQMLKDELLNPDHPPPYMALLVIFVFAGVEGSFIYLLKKYDFAVTDYKIPFIIYTTCLSVSAFLLTIVLGDGFSSDVPGYDVFQIITGCYGASFLLMRVPHFFDRLYAGKVCPLREGEIMYALNHFGL